MKRRKKQNPGRRQPESVARLVPVLQAKAKLGETRVRWIKQTAAAALTAVIISTSTFTTQASAQALAQQAPPQPVAITAQVPLITMETMITAGTVPYDESKMQLTPEQSSGLKRFVKSIVSGAMLPNVTLADQMVAGVGGNELGYSYGKEIADKLDKKNAPNATSDDEELAAIPDLDSAGEKEDSEETAAPRGPEDSSEDSFQSPSLGRDAPDTEAPDKLETTPENFDPAGEIAQMGIPGTSPSPEPSDQPADQPAPELAQGPSEPETSTPSSALPTTAPGPQDGPRPESGTNAPELSQGETPAQSPAPAPEEPQDQTTVPAPTSASDAQSPADEQLPPPATAAPQDPSASPQPSPVPEEDSGEPQMGQPETPEVAQGPPPEEGGDTGGEYPGYDRTGQHNGLDITSPGEDRKEHQPEKDGKSPEISPIGGGDTEKNGDIGSEGGGGEKPGHPDSADPKPKADGPGDLMGENPESGLEPGTAPEITEGQRPDAGNGSPDPGGEQGSNEIPDPQAPDNSAPKETAPDGTNPVGTNPVGTKPNETQTGGQPQAPQDRPQAKPQANDSSPKDIGASEDIERAADRYSQTGDGDDAYDSVRKDVAAKTGNEAPSTASGSAPGSAPGTTPDASQKSPQPTGQTPGTPAPDTEGFEDSPQPRKQTAPEPAQKQGSPVLAEENASHSEAPAPAGPADSSGNNEGPAKGPAPRTASGGDPRSHNVNLADSPDAGLEPKDASEPAEGPQPGVRNTPANTGPAQAFVIESSGGHSTIETVLSGGERTKIYDGPGSFDEAVQIAMSEGAVPDAPVPQSLISEPQAPQNPPASTETERISQPETITEPAAEQSPEMAPAPVAPVAPTAPAPQPARDFDLGNEIVGITQEAVSNLDQIQGGVLEESIGTVVDQGLADQGLIDATAMPTDMPAPAVDAAGTQVADTSYTEPAYTEPAYTEPVLEPAYSEPAYTEPVPAPAYEAEPSYDTVVEEAAPAQTAPAYEPAPASQPSYSGFQEVAPAPAPEQTPAPQYQPAPAATPVQETVPVQHAAPIQQTDSIQETAPVQEAAPVQQSAAVQEAAPAGQSGSVDITQTTSAGGGASN